MTSMSTTRDNATKVLKSYWASIEKFDRKYAETGDPNALVQLNHLKKMCMEVMEKVTDGESNSYTDPKGRC